MDLLSNFAASTVLFMIGAVTAILLFLAYLSVRNPVLMKIGLRNLVRRPGQSVLIVIGMTLSTIIIISAFGTGDTLSNSVKRQAVSAYGEVDEIIAPPILSLFATIESSDGEDAAVSELEQTFGDLTAGGLESVLAFVQGGLPSLGVDRLEQLRTEAEAEPLIDGVSGAIVFPTILRNTSTGAGEPLGVIYAVDDQYPQTFGLVSVDGRPLEMTSLQPGIGNIFLQASNLFSLVSNQVGRLTGDAASPTARAIAGLGAIFTGIAANQLPDLSIDLETLRELGVDTAPLEAMGIEKLDVGTIATALGLSDEQTGEITGQVQDTLGAVSDTANDLLRAVNLNTLGYEIDRVLGQYGLQMRQGDIYLSRLAADRLGAHAGDVVEVYVGPLPVRFRVRAVVEQAGPMSALVPVVMMPLAEAQQLLFMNDKVNTVLVSNVGDELSGLEYADEVTDRLSMLAMDPNSVERIRSVLRRPEVAPIVQEAAPSLLEVPPMDPNGEEDIPQFVQNIFETIGESLGIQSASEEEVTTLLAVLGGDDEADLREPLMNTSLRTWLLDLDLPQADKEELQDAMKRLNSFDVVVPLSKSTVVIAATVGGTVFSSVFSLFGALSILAAILLIFLIFVMLAAERRSEIGMARAVGTQRRQVVQMFVTEGMVYALAASALGVLIGIGVTLAMTAFIGDLFSNLSGRFNAQVADLFKVSFHISWQSIVISYCLGVVLTFVVIVVASYRVSRMNIVSAIRDLPDRGGIHSRRGLRGVWRWALPALVAAGGIGLLVYTTPHGLYGGALLGASLLLLGGMLLVGRVLEQMDTSQDTVDRIVYSATGLGLLVLWVLPWGRWLPQIAPDLWSYSPIQLPLVFLSGAILIVVGAIMVIMVNADAIGWLASRALGFIPWLRPVLRTAIAYPLNTRFRTGMTMVLFAMIMASVVVMAVVIHATQSLVTLDEQSTAGFDIQVSPTLLSFFSPVDDFEATLAAQGDESVLAEVDVVGEVSRDVVRARAGGGRWMYSGINGLNAGYADQAMKVYPLQARAEGYESDEDVWRALAAGEDVAVILPRKLGNERRGRYDEGSTEFDVGSDFGSSGDGADERRDMWRNELFLPDVVIENGLLPDTLVEVQAIAESGEEVPPSRTLQVIGVLADDESLAWSGLQTSSSVLLDVLGKKPADVQDYVKVREGADVHAVARDLERAFVPNGLNAVVLEDRFLQGQQLMAGILRLLQGFMALGLLVGIAALGVLSTRAVVERRQQVGMLRAIGFQRQMVGLSFVLESSFIALSGLLIGALTGVVLGGLVLQTSFPEVGLASAEAIPWLTIFGIVIAAYLFSLLTTIVPVWQATRIYPAEALRYE
ncbi:MAG: ABC transporter permease [Caldilineaceae bacterium]